MFEQGHYAGRTRPTNTRQGTYATAPSGVLLASINSNDPNAMADMLRRALDRWNAMSESERMNVGAAARTSEVRRPEQKYPTDGLVLRVFSRDLPRENTTKDWRKDAWNQDYAWFTKAEAKSLLPTRLEPGQKAEAGKTIAERLARLNFVDNVRGQVPPFDPGDVRTARLESEVVGVANGIVRLKLAGESATEKEGTWPVAGYQDMNAPSPQKRGVSVRLLGSAEYDTRLERFRAFELVAVGTRHGATQYNGRHDDRGPAPIGYLATLAGDSPAERVAPAFYWSYGW
ncbi:MAG TPA: hypothetical protein VGE01_10680 [Fimbriimonas sp.]